MWKSNTQSLLCSRLRECVFCSYKSHIICYSRGVIITGDVLLITCKHVQTHIHTRTKACAHSGHYSRSRGALLQDRIPVMCFLSIDHREELQMFYFDNGCMDVGLSGENYMMKYNCNVFWHFLCKHAMLRAADLSLAFFAVLRKEFRASAPNFSSVLHWKVKPHCTKRVL